MRCINILDLIWFDLYDSLSRDIVGRVSPDHLSQFHLKDVSTFFPPGKLITVHVLRCVSPYIEPLHNYQHYQKRTQSTLFCDPLPPSLLKEYFENVDFCDPLMKMQCIIINIKKAYQPWTPPPVYSVYSRENDDNYGWPLSHKTFYLLTFDWCLAFYFFHPHLFLSFFLMFLTVLFPLLWWSIFHVIRLQAAQSCVCSLDNPFSVKSCLKLSIHFRFGHSLLLPVDITVTLLLTHSSSLLMSVPPSHTFQQFLRYFSHFLCSSNSFTFFTFLDHLLVQGRPLFESSSISDLVPCLQSVGISSCLPLCYPSISFSVSLCFFSPKLPVLAISQRCGWVLAANSGQTTLVFCFLGKFQLIIVLICALLIVSRFVTSHLLFIFYLIVLFLWNRHFRESVEENIYLPVLEPCSSIDEDKNVVDLSLLEEHTGVPECIPADQRANLKNHIKAEKRKLDAVSTENDSKRKRSSSETDTSATSRKTTKRSSHAGKVEVRWSFASCRLDEAFTI